MDQSLFYMLELLIGSVHAYIPSLLQGADHMHIIFNYFISKAYFKHADYASCDFYQILSLDVCISIKTMIFWLDLCINML